VTTQSKPFSTKASVVFDPTKPFRPPTTKIILLYLPQIPRKPLTYYELRLENSILMMSKTINIPQNW